MGKRKQTKTVEKFKSRKEVRKEKRLQKKANRVHFQKRKKELNLERKERLQQKGKTKNQSNKKDKTNEKIRSVKNKVPTADFEDDLVETVGDYDDDEEIESDFELSDEELEKKTKAMSKQQE